MVPKEYPPSQGVDYHAEGCMAPGSGVFHGVSRKPGHLLEFWGLAPASEALQGRTEYFPSYSWDEYGEFIFK